MRSTSLFCVLAFLCNTLSAQYVYTIKADSVKLTNCDSSELIIENHTQNVPGFLFNTGKGRTIFKRGAQKLNDSAYLIGGDTLNLGARAWVQGGNSFNDTGFLGTLNNTHLDLYTNKLRRARLTNNGNLLLGTTTDNGNKLQVNGASSFSGNVGIGSATITNTGSLIGTNAILFDHVVSENHDFQQGDIHISRLENILYDYQERFNSTTTSTTDSIIIDMIIPPSELGGWAGLIYPQGKMCLSFWSNGVPSAVSIKMYDNNNHVWAGPFTSNTNLGGATGYFEVAIPGSFNYMNEIRIAIARPGPGGYVNLQNIEYLLSSSSQGLSNPFPYVSKAGSEHIYGDLYFRKNGIDNVHFSGDPGGSDYFLNKVLIGSTADNATSSKLQVTGDMNTTGGVRFSGLANNNSQTRVIVSDVNGNLFYRDASTLAASDPIRSSLAVNGPITAQKLTLSAHNWPDYVFDSVYQLLSLPNLEKYIQQHNHLPGIPAASVVERNGTDVGETQAVLLKKIEELTLYTIEQDKRLTDQKSEIEVLKKKMEYLERLVVIKSEKAK